MSSRIERVTNDPHLEDSYKRFTGEVMNKAFVIAFLAVKELCDIDQKEYCKRAGINESRFSRVLNKILGVPVKKRSRKQKKSASSIPALAV